MYNKEGAEINKKIIEKIDEERNTQLSKNIDVIQMDDLKTSIPNIAQTRLRTNWPFNNNDSSKARNNEVAWWDLYKKLWSYGFAGAETIQQASFTLNNEKKNSFDPVEPRMFLRDYANQVYWMNPNEWGKEADVESCFISVDRHNIDDKIKVFNPDGNLEYEQDRKDLSRINGLYIYRTGAFKEFVDLLKNDSRTHYDYLRKPYWEWKRNQWPSGPVVADIYTVNNDGELLLSPKNSHEKADDGYKTSYRVLKHFHRRKYQDKWTTIVPPDKAFGDHMYLSFADEAEAESKLSLIRTLPFRYLECFGRYSRNPTKGNLKFQPNMPLDRIWTDDSVIDYWKIPASLVDRINKDMENYERWFKHFEGH